MMNLTIETSNATLAQEIKETFELQVITSEKLNHSKAKFIDSLEIMFVDCYGYEFGQSGSHYWIHKNNKRVAMLTELN